MVGAFENVPEAGRDETQRGLVPARIEAHQAGIAVKLERKLDKRAILESVRWRGRAGQAPLARSSVQELTSASGNGAAGFEQPRRERANLF